MTADYTIADLLSLALTRFVVIAATCGAAGAFYAWVERRLS